MPEIYIETYLGCDIYYYTPPDVSEPVYSSPCITGWFKKKSAVRKRICEKQGGTWEDGVCTFVPEPPEPPPDEPHIEEVYRGVEIWHQPISGTFTAQVAPGYLAAGWTLQECRVDVDRVLALLNPPEEPETGLFAQVVAAVKAWVLQNMPDWLLEWGRVVNNWITNVVEEITNVYHYITEEITNIVNNTYKYVTKVYKTFEDYVTNVYNYVTKEITNVYNNTYQNITNVIGITQQVLDKAIADNREWAVNFFKLMDPTGFLKDPLGTVKAAWFFWASAADEAVVKSFWEGFEEGLEE